MLDKLVKLSVQKSKLTVICPKIQIYNSPTRPGPRSIPPLLSSCVNSLRCSGFQCIIGCRPIRFHCSLSTWINPLFYGDYNIDTNLTSNAACRAHKNISFIHKMQYRIRFLIFLLGSPYLLKILSIFGRYNSISFSFRNLETAQKLIKQYVAPSSEPNGNSLL